MHFELNIDGLVGPSHHYAGLSDGNLASTNNALSLANPLAAACQGIKKMAYLHKKGISQAVLPPHYRPNLALLQQMGFTGTPENILLKAYQKAPELLSAAYSASSMWTANAATVSSSLDTADKKVHFTAANLITNLHRHQEAEFSKRLLEKIFADQDYFAHHPILPCSMITADEGAANYGRLSSSHSDKGISLFVYGKKGLHNQLNLQPVKYPARQTLEASEAIARQHQLSTDKTLFILQNPKVIDQGVFHNDVISVANENVFFVHEEAFYQQQAVYEKLQKMADFNLCWIEVPSEKVSVKDAVSSYLFNSQLITLPEHKGMLLLSPAECEQNTRVKAYIDWMIKQPDNPINDVCYMNLKQSMRNGGGPACLRLRVPLSQEALSAMHQGVIITDELLVQLESWVEKYYREELSYHGLADPKFITEIETALDELSQILKLGSIYPFQQL